MSRSRGQGPGATDAYSEDNRRSPPPSLPHDGGRERAGTREASARRVKGAIRWVAAWIARLEVLAILALAPFFIFPRPGLTPWLMALVPVLWLCRWVAHGRLTVRTPLDWPILILAIMLLVSLWATYDPLLSFPKVSGVFLGIALFYAVVNSVRSERAVWLATALVVAGGAAIAGAALLGTHWSMRKVPLLAPLQETLYQGLPALLRGVPRAEEGFNPNQVGGTLVLFVPLMVVLLVHRLRRPRWRAGWIAATLGLAGALVLVSCVLVLTQSRFAYFSAGLALLLVGLSQKGPLRVLTILVLVLGVGLMLYLGPVALAEGAFGFRTRETMSSAVSWAGRVEIWQRALRVVRDHPLTGIGFDTLYPVIHARYPTFLMPAGRDVTHAHNVYLQVALDLGVPGLAAFLWLIASLGRMLWRVWRARTSPAQRALALGLLTGLAAQLIWGLADAIALGQKPGIFLWAYFGLGAALWRVSLGQAERAEVHRAISPAVFFRRLLTAYYRPLVLVLALAVALGWGTRTLWRARTWVTLLQSDLAAAQALAQGGPQAVAPLGPEELLRQTNADLRGLQAEFAFPLALASHLGWVPRYGADIRAAPALVQIGILLTGAGGQALEPFGPLLSGQDAGRAAAPEAAVAAIDQAQPQLREALAAVQEARAIRQTAIDAERLSPRLAGWVDQLDRALPLLESGLQAGLALPELAGTSEPRTYLVLIQNDDELRPTGGFISGVARVTVHEGRVTELLFEDSYAVDDFSQPYPDPPLPLRDVMGSDLWLFRDSNWSPDFPTSARAAVELYRLKYDVEIDGVLALDQRAVRLFVAALGPVEVEGYAEPVTGENVVRAIRESWAQAEGEGMTGEWWRQRKDFIGHLSAAILDKVQGGTGELNLTRLAWAALQALEERHLFVYLPDGGPAGDALHAAGWDGALGEGAGDYLMVVDANVGFNKASPLVTEALSYTVDLRDPDRPQAELLLTHRHTAPARAEACDHAPRYDATYEGMMHRCYWDYVRVYAPGGSQLLEATRHPVPGELLVTGLDRDGEVEVLSDGAGKATFATLLVLAPGERAETRYVYELPSEVVVQEGGAWRYSLTIQKQGGAGDHRASVTLILPPGAKVISSDPAPVERMGNTLSYELLLRTDLELEVRLQVP